MLTGKTNTSKDQKQMTDCETYMKLLSQMSGQIPNYVRTVNELEKVNNPIKYGQKSRCEIHRKYKEIIF